MNKKYIKYKTATSVALALMFPFLSCDDKEKEENLSPATIYFVNSDAENANVYDLAFLDIGEEYGAFNLALYKSGVDQNEASVRIAVLTESELAQYNEKHGKDFVLMTTDSYIIETNEVTFSGQYSDLNKIVPVKFDLAKLRLEDEKAVLPVKIAESSVAKNEDKSLIVIRPKVRDALIYFTDGGEKHSRTYVEGEAEDLSFDILTLLEIDDNKWDVEVEIEVATDYVAQYNQEYGGNYQLWPAGSYSLETEKTIRMGEKSASFSLTVMAENLEVGQYLLPVRLKSSSQFKIDERSLFYVKMDIRTPVPPAPLDRTGWDATGNTEEATGESGGNNGRYRHALDNNLSTFWHSKWQGGMDQPPHIIIIDMKQNYTLTAVGLMQRQHNAEDQRTAKSGNFAISSNNNVWTDSGLWTDNSAWTTIGTFTDLLQILDEQVIPVTPTNGRYLKVTLINTWHWDPVTSLAEIKPIGY